MGSEFSSKYSPAPGSVTVNLKLPKTESIESDECGYEQLPDLLQYPHSVLPISAKPKRFTPMESPPLPSLASSSSSEQARKRRKTTSEKIRTLEKILPWEKKMNTATMLGEVFKYIKFLQAQVSVLQSMPCLSLMDSSCNGTNGDGGFGGLEKLNRQQLLQVLMNSDASQTVLSSKGSCVYSLEQVLLLNASLMEKLMMFGP